MGIVFSYIVFNQLFNSIIKLVKEVIKLVAYNPNSIIIYNNFNFQNRIREFKGGRKYEIVNLTTVCLINCPKLNGPLK